MAGELGKVIEKLELCALNPRMVAERADELSHLRYANYDAFISHTTKLFSPLVRPLDPNNPTARISIPEVMATTFAAINPLDQPRKSHLNKNDGDASKLVQQFMGMSHVDDPVFFVIKSMREKDSTWLDKDFEKIPVFRKKGFLRDVAEIKRRLLMSINLMDVKQALAKHFDNALNTKLVEVKTDLEDHLNKEYNYLHATAPGRNRRKEAKFSRENAPKMKLTNGIILYGKLADRFTDESMADADAKTEVQSPGPMQSIMMDLLTFDRIPESEFLKDSLPSQDVQKPIVTIDRKGSLHINETKVNFFMEARDNEDIVEARNRLSSIFGKGNHQDMITAALISCYSSKREGPNISWLLKSAKDNRHYFNNVRRLTHSFRQSLQQVASEDDVVKQVSKEFEHAIRRGVFNYSEVNQQIARILYSNFVPVGGKSGADIRTIDQFLRLPGVRPAIVALRKVFLLQQLKRQIIDIDLYHKKHFIMDAHTDISQELREYIDKYKKLQSKPLIAGEFVKTTQSEIVSHMAYFAVEKYLSDNSKFFKDRRLVATLKDGHIGIEIPDKLNPSKTNVITVAEGVYKMGMPIITKLEKVEDSGKDRLYLRVVFYDRILGQIPIEVANREN